MLTLSLRMRHICAFLDHLSFCYFLATCCHFQNLRLTLLNFAPILDKQGKVLRRSKLVQQKCLRFFQKFQKFYCYFLFNEPQWKWNVSIFFCVTPSGVLRTQSNISDGIFFRKHLTAFSRYFCKKATSYMFDWFVSTPPTPGKN